MDPNELNGDGSGLDRRSVLKRGAVLSGAMVWTVPAVQTIAGPAFAAGSPLCNTTLISIVTRPNGTCKKTTTTFESDVACCECIDASPYDESVALGVCGAAGTCKKLSTTTTTC